MAKLFNAASIAIGAVGGVLSYFLGGFDMLLKALLILAVLDYATGIAKAWSTKTLSSEIGLKGIVKKVMIFVIVCVAYVIEQVMGGSVALRDLVIMFFIANEGISLLENASVFIPLPDKLKNALLQIRGDKEEK